MSELIVYKIGQLSSDAYHGIKVLFISLLNMPLSTSIQYAIVTATYDAFSG